MNLLMVGSGNGSMAMRGSQLGKALRARVVGAPSSADLQWADVVVLVKRAGAEWALVVRASGKPIVWDALDFWVQPDENVLDGATAKKYLRDQIQAIRPALVIGATQAMAEDCGGVYLPHHTWLGLTATPARPVVKMVGYQGTRKFLGQWERTLTDECQRRNWTFVLNPPDLRACDLLVAFRDGKHDGWMCREWKSGVKLVNAMAAGRPMITQESAAWREIRPMGCTVQTQAELSRAFDLWSAHALRQQAVQQTVAPYDLATLASRYQRILADVQKAQAA